MRALLLDGPQWIFDQIAIIDAWIARVWRVVWAWYWLLIAAASILCLVTAALTLMAGLLQIPWPGPPPGPAPSAGTPVGPRVAADGPLTATEYQPPPGHCSWQ